MSASPFHNSRRFAGKRLHLGVCGSIACYKALDLLRALHALDIHVSVTLTDGARRFVTPLLFEALGAMPVYGRMFEGDEVFDHLEPGQRAQAMLVAPASADALSRLAAGAASDMLSAQALAFDGPLVVAPAMNPRMWRHPATQDNVATLRRRGARVVVPGLRRHGLRRYRARAVWPRWRIFFWPPCVPFRRRTWRDSASC